MNLETTTQATTDAEAVAILEALARRIAFRNGMASGYVDIHMGAGNPDYFFQINYKHDGYGPDGWAETAPPCIEACGRTLIVAVNLLVPLVLKAHP